MGALGRQLQLSAAVLLVMLLPAIIQAGTFSPIITGSESSSISARGISLQAAARAAGRQNFTCSRDDDYLNQPK
jgi:hypothetical protein